MWFNLPSKQTPARNKELEFLPGFVLFYLKFYHDIFTEQINDLFSALRENDYFIATIDYELHYGNNYLITAFGDIIQFEIRRYSNNVRVTKRYYGTVQI